MKKIFLFQEGCIQMHKLKTCCSWDCHVELVGCHLVHIKHIVRLIDFIPLVLVGGNAVSHNEFFRKVIQWKLLPIHSKSLRPNDLVKELQLPVVHFFFVEVVSTHQFEPWVDLVGFLLSLVGNGYLLSFLSLIAFFIDFFSCSWSRCRCISNSSFLQ